MKLNIEKIVFYCMLVLVSGSIGYALKPEPELVKENQISYEQQNEACVRAISMMKSVNPDYYKPKTKKEWAIERMMNN